MSNIKKCSGCSKIKMLEDGFYRAGNSWQKLCKLCHNESRCLYTHKGGNYVKKLTGFYKLSEDTQNAIKYDIKVRVNFRDISKKYKLNYNTLLNWNKKGIPEYQGEIKLN